MASLFDKQLDVFENNIELALDSNFNKLVNAKMKTLQKRMEMLQQDFFTILAQKIIGAGGAPNLAGYTPSWKPLKESYTEQREWTQDVPENEFFRFSGKMESTLNRLNPKTFLGKPVVTYKRGKYQQRTQQTYNAPNRKRFDQPLRATVEIDLFPRIQGSINGVDEKQLFDSVKLSWVTERRGSKTTTTPISYRFKNFQGKRERPVIVEYLNWWLKVKARKTLREIVK